MSRFVCVTCGEDDSSCEYEPISEGSISISESPSTDDEIRLQALLTSDDIDIQWCSQVDNLLRKQTQINSAHDWLDISLKLLEIIQRFTEKDMSIPRAGLRQCQRAKHIDVELGLQLLGDGPVEPRNAEERMLLRELEQEAEIMKMQMTRKNNKIEALQRHLNHWKFIAKLRLIELKREFDMQERFIFGKQN